jgi:hypothetical protein
MSRIALVLLLFGTACASNQSSSTGSQGAVTDTLGNSYDVFCGSAICLLNPRDPNVVPVSCDAGSGTDTFALIVDRILSIHVLKIKASGEFQLNTAEPGHPIACQTDADCLPSGIPVLGMNITYTCSYGLCQNLQNQLRTTDVLTLCQADLPWPKDCPYMTSPGFAKRIAEVAESCGSTTYCSMIPADCRQIQPGQAVDSGI